MRLPCGTRRPGTNTGLYVNGTKIKNITATGTGNWFSGREQVECVSLRGGTKGAGWLAPSSNGGDG